MFLHVWRQSYQYSDLLFQHEAALNLPNGGTYFTDYSATTWIHCNIVAKTRSASQSKYPCKYWVYRIGAALRWWLNICQYLSSTYFFYQFILASRETAAEKLSKICFRSFRNISPLVCPPVKVDDFLFFFFTVKCSVSTFSVQTLLSLHKLIWRTCRQSSHWETLAFILSHISVQRMKSNIPSPFSSVFGLHQPPRKRSDSFAPCSPARH